MTKYTTSTPHDAVFKHFMRHKDSVCDFLEIYLPPALRQRCDLRTLKPESTSFIEEDLRAYYADMLWSMKTTSGEGYLYVVIEHQSSSVAHMPFRMMRYAIAAMQNHLDAGHKHLPLVVPMLFYHGEISPCPLSLCWLDEFADPALARQLYTRAFPLVDITTTADDDIMQHRRVALLEFMLKHIRQRDLLALVDPLVTLLGMGYTTGTQLKALFNYIVQYGDAPRFREFLSQLAERLPQHKEELMTIAERLHEEGRQKGHFLGRQEGLEQGLEQGLQEGLQQGKHAEALRIARAMLENGLDRETVVKMTGLSVDEIMAVSH